MQNTWRPERRNRNIGTSAAGYSHSNDMRIPESWTDRDGNFTVYYERLNTPLIQKLHIGSHSVTAFFETPRDGFTYGCNPRDAVHLLSMIADNLPVFPELLVFRQPTQKQRSLKPVWGRYVYYAEICGHKGDAIILEAQKPGNRLVWPKRMTLEDRAELNRLIEDGHMFSETKRAFEAP